MTQDNLRLMISGYAVITYLMIRAWHRLYFYAFLLLTYITLIVQSKLTFLLVAVKKANLGPALSALILLAPLIAFVIYAFVLNERYRSGQLTGAAPSIDVFFERTRINILFWICLALFNIIWMWVSK